MRRFFVPSELLVQSSARLDGELYRHIVTVLRMSEGNRLILADGQGGVAEALITCIGSGELNVDLFPFIQTNNANQLKVTLCQALPKGEKSELILQKGTELGVTDFILFDGERSVARAGTDKLPKKLARWEKIVREAARQSERDTIPTVTFEKSIKDAVAANQSELKLLLWESEEERGLKTVLENIPPKESALIIVGPEGGFTQNEVKTAVSAGAITVSLGKRILRTETAGIAAIAALQYAWGDLG